VFFTFHTASFFWLTKNDAYCINKLCKLSLRENNKEKNNMQNLSHKHDKHTVEIGAGSGPHYASLRCKDCNVHIAWLSKSQYFVAARHLTFAAINELKKLKNLTKLKK
jgi:hypothetical protein